MNKCMVQVDYAGMVVIDEQDGLMVIKSGIQISGAHKALMFLPSVVNWVFI